MDSLTSTGTPEIELSPIIAPQLSPVAQLSENQQPLWTNVQENTKKSDKLGNGTES